MPNSNSSRSGSEVENSGISNEVILRKIMRYKLKRYLGEKLDFEGKLSKILPDPKKKSRRICLFHNIKLTVSDEILTDHLYLKQTGGLRDRKPGAILQFRGKVTSYKKNYAGEKIFQT